MREPFQSKKIKLKRRQRPSSVDSYVSAGSGSRSNSGSLTSSSGTLVSLTPSSKSSESKKSEASTGKSEASNKKKSEKGHLKVSINETAQLIEDRGSNSERFSFNSQISEDHSSANVDNDKLQVNDFYISHLLGGIFLNILAFFFFASCSLVFFGF